MQLASPYGIDPRAVRVRIERFQLHEYFWRTAASGLLCFRSGIVAIASASAIVAVLPEKVSPEFQSLTRLSISVCQQIVRDSTFATVAVGVRSPPHQI